MTALELADELQDRVKPYAGSEHWDDIDAAAHELRRLHDDNRELLDTLRLALAQLESFEVSIDSEWGDCRTIEELYRDTESPPSALSGALSPATIQTRAMLNKHEEQT